MNNYPEKLFTKDVFQFICDGFFNDTALEVIGKEKIEEIFYNLLCNLNIPPSFTTIRLMDSKTNLTILEQYLESVAYKNDFVINRHAIIEECLVIKHQPLSTVTQITKEVIIDLKCGIAVMRGAHIFVPGIISINPEVQKGDEVSVFIDVNKTCLKGQKKFNGTKFFVGNGISLFNRRNLFVDKSACGIGIEMRKPIYASPSLYNLPPDFFAQNLPSMVAVRVLNPQPFEVILDMCAAPGGKTMHIASLMKNKGRIIAIDKSNKRIEKVKKLSQRFNFDIIESYCADSTNLLQLNNKVLTNISFPKEYFDKILLDAPCSGIGKRPIIKCNLSIKHISSFPTLQKQLISAAFDLLKPGGTLIYSTCTICTQENEQIVAYALKQFPQLKLAKQISELGVNGWPTTHLSYEETKLLQRFLPTHGNMDNVNNDTNAFFIAKFIKNNVF